MSDELTILKHAVGFETAGDKHTPIFVRGLHLPVAWSKMLLPARENQAEIIIHLLQGDSSEAKECASIATFKIKGISPRRNREGPEIMLTLEIDTQGEMRCQAHQLPDRGLVIEGSAKQILIEPVSTFSGYGGFWGIG